MIEERKFFFFLSTEERKKESLFEIDQEVTKWGEWAMEESTRAKIPSEKLGITCAHHLVCDQMGKRAIKN